MEGESMERLCRIVDISGAECRRLRVPAVALAAGLLLGGCAAPRVVSLQPPELQLLDAGALEMPPDCEPARGVVYRTGFVVLPDGRVEAVASGSDSGCVQEALRQWVATFRYRPVGQPTVLDWVVVTGTRGG